MNHFFLLIILYAIIVNGVMTILVEINNQQKSFILNELKKNNAKTLISKKLNINN